MDNLEEVLKLAEPDPEQTAAIQQMGTVPKPDFSDMAAVRKISSTRVLGLVEAMGPAAPHCTESYVDIPLRDGYKSHARLWTPAQPAAGGSPLVVMLYGGGFVMGTVEQMALYARDLCRQYGATVLAPAYRLAPESPWPAAPHDAWDATRWAATHAAELGADTTAGFVLGGVSAGANLSAVVAAQWLEEELSPPLTGIWLSVPLVFAKRDQVPEQYRDFYRSMEQNANTPVLGADAMKAMHGFYAPDVDSPLYAPVLRAAVLAKMPPVYLQACGMDPLRDDALIYDRMLKAADRKSLLHVYPGLVHAGWNMFPKIRIARQARIDVCVGFGWLFGMKPRENVDPAQP